MPEKKVSEFQQQILNAIELGSYNQPMVTIYKICRLMHQPQERSTNKFYIKVYRAMEGLVEIELAQVMRGTRDPSVYLLYSLVKGYDKYGLREIPF